MNESVITNNEDAKQFIGILNYSLEKRFEFEIKSSTYRAAAVLKFESLKKWVGRDWSK